MRRFTQIFTFLLLGTSFAFGQVTCNGDRYYNQIFSLVTSSLDVVYGQSTNYDGSTKTLKMDIYQPTGDIETARPLIILAHGGSFVGGDKNASDVTELCQRYAKRGYVTASIQYRLGLNLSAGVDSISMSGAVVRAVHDMKAAIRFFKKGYTESANPYKIDTSLIFLGGSSAGAITALHTAYMDRISKVPPYIQTIMAADGGLEGNSGNAGYSDKIKAVVNLCGAMSEKEWIYSDDEPVCHVHGTNDNTVPYGSATIYAFGLFPIKVMDGSGALHPYIQSQGIYSVLKTFPGQDHVPYLNSPIYMDSTDWFVRDFLYDQLCSSVGTTPAYLENIKLYPNPANSYVNIELAQIGDIEILNSNGQLMLRKEQVQNWNLSTATLPKGLYLVNIRRGKQQESRKLVVE